MDRVIRQLAVVTIAFGVWAWQSNLNAATAAAGSSFNSRGKIVLHRGEPCTSQIMFDFRPLNATTIVWMAADAHDSAKLTEAAGAHRRVRITGIWRRGQHTGCAYVEVTKLVLERSWLESLFKP